MAGSNGQATQVRLVPGDLLAEQLLLTAMMHSLAACEVVIEAEAVLPDHFYGPANQTIFAAIVQLYLDGKSTDPTAVSGWLDRIGLLDAVGGAYGVVDAATGDYAGLETGRLPTHCERVKALAGMRAGQAAAQELGERSRIGADPAGLADGFRLAGDQIDAQITGTSAEGEYTVDDLLAAGDAPVDWVVPDTLERGDVLMLTAGSGVGKSLFLFQFALQCAAGRHPFHPGRAIPALKALYIQVENSPAEEGRRMTRMIGMAERFGFDRTKFTAWMPKDGVNLSTAQGVAALRLKIVKHRPDIVVLSPWKDVHDPFTSQGDGGEGAFTRIKHQLDAMKRKYGFCLLIEAHATAAQAGSTDPDAYRPRGTVAQANWATYGLCLIPKQNDAGVIRGQYLLGQWRGARDRTRQFPAEMWEGTVWPWMPADSIAVDREPERQHRD